MRLNTIYNTTRKNSKRLGRGIGSGKGKTCGSGHKGQKARTGVAIKGFEGGQMPLNIRLPKRGFNNPNKVRAKVINLGQIGQAIKSGALQANKITKIDLKNVGLIANIKKPVKLLAKGVLSESVSIEVDYVSKAAQAAIENLSGKVLILAPSVKKVPNEKATDSKDKKSK